MLAYLTKLFSAQKHVRIISQPYIPFAIMLLILGTVPVLRWESMVFSFDDPMSFVFAFLGTAYLVFIGYEKLKVNLLTVHRLVPADIAKAMSSISLCFCG